MWTDIVCMKFCQVLHVVLIQRGPWFLNSLTRVQQSLAQDQHQQENYVGKIRLLISADAYANQSNESFVLKSNHPIK